MTDISRTSSERGCCRCWIPVVGALLVVISIADCGLAIVLGSFADLVHDLKQQVEDSSTEMSVAGIFRRLTGGLVNLGDSQAGLAVRNVADELPSYWVMATLAWGRVGICVAGFVFGWLLCWRVRFVPTSLITWGIFSLVWGLLSVSEARVIFRALLVEDLTIVGVVLSALATFLHFIWPLFIVIRMFIGIRAGDFARS